MTKQTGSSGDLAKGFDAICFVRTRVGSTRVVRRLEVLNKITVDTHLDTMTWSVPTRTMASATTRGPAVVVLLRVAVEHKQNVERAAR